MSRLPWKAGNRHCPNCGQLQQGPPESWHVHLHLARDTWRCPGCSALLGYDGWRWPGILLGVAAVCLLVLMIWLIDPWIGLIGMFVVFGLQVLWLPWHVSIVVKEEKGEKS